VIVVPPAPAAPASGAVVRTDPRTGERVRYVPLPYAIPAPAAGAPLVALDRDGSAALAPLRSDSLASPVGVPPRIDPPSRTTLAPLERARLDAGQPGVRVVEVERALLETGLFRAVGVNFEFDKSTLLDGATSLIDPVGEVMQRFPDLRLLVAGHTDAIGPDAFNERLSRERAQTVRRYLIERWSISPSRLETIGLGETEPLATNANPTGRALNRRVEFRVLPSAPDLP
jgi:outer membrane protein OmpA-like peptidoglycan-associated protein